MNRRVLLVAVVLAMTSCGTDDPTAVGAVVSIQSEASTSVASSTTVAETTSIPSSTPASPTTSVPPPQLPVLSVRVDTDHVVQVAPQQVCDAGGACTTTDETVPDFDTGAMVSQLVLSIDAADAEMEVIEPELVALPRRDGTWVVENPATIEPTTFTIVVHLAVDAGATFSFRVLRQMETGDDPFLLGERPSRTLASVDAAQWPADMPTIYFGYRSSTGDLVRVDRASGDETILTNVELPGSDPESCPDSCGVYHVSPSPDGALVYFGGPGPAVGQVFVVPADSRGQVIGEPIFGGSTRLSSTSATWAGNRSLSAPMACWSWCAVGPASRDRSPSTSSIRVQGPSSTRSNSTRRQTAYLVG